MKLNEVYHLCIVYCLICLNRRIKQLGLISVYKKNLNPFKFKLAIKYCSNLPALIALNSWLIKKTRSCTHGKKLKEIKIRKYKRNTVFLLNFLIFISLSFVPGVQDLVFLLNHNSKQLELSNYYCNTL